MPCARTYPAGHHETGQRPTNLSLQCLGFGDSPPDQNLPRAPSTTLANSCSVWTTTDREEYTGLYETSAKKKKPPAYSNKLKIFMQRRYSFIAVLHLTLHCVIQSQQGLPCRVFLHTRSDLYPTRGCVSVPVRIRRGTNTKVYPSALLTDIALHTGA